MSLSHGPIVTGVSVCAGEGGPAAEVPLDGTVYDLETGKVLVWCPKNNPLRFVLGSLKVRQLAICSSLQDYRSRQPGPISVLSVEMHRDSNSMFLCGIAAA